jgi:hypothetical protein
MHRVALSELLGLSRDLDIFAASPPYPEELLQQGLHPPLPLAAGLLVWGFPILRRAAQRGLEALPCVGLPPLPRRELLRIALQLEGRAGSYGWSEKEGMLRFLEGPAEEAGGEAGGEGSEPGRELEALGPLIEGCPAPKLAARLAGFRALPALLQQLLERGWLELETAHRVRELPEEVFALLGRSRLSFAQRRLFLQDLFEVGRRDGLAPGELSALAQGLLGAAQPLAELQRLRSPTLATLSRRFQELSRELLSGSGVRLLPPPAFEGDSFCIRFQFRSARGLSRALNALQRLREGSDELLALLR